MKAKPQTLGLVVRVSRVGKREGERFQSPGDQIAIGTSRANAAGYEVQVFDADAQNGGISGATPFDDRHGMGEALRLVEEGKLAGIVVAAQDRLVREDAEAGVTLKSFQRRIRAAGAVLLVADNFDAEVLDPEAEEREGLEEIGTESRVMYDSLYRREMRKRWRRARRNAVERGAYVGPTPAGYDRNAQEPQISGDARTELTPEERWADPVPGQLVPTERAPAIVAAYEARAAQKSWSVVARILTEAGVPTSRGNMRWSLKAAEKLLRNEAYLGVARSGPFRNDEAHQPLVGRALWKAANDRRETRAVVHGERVPSLLAGMLKCGTCGHRMTRDFVRRGQRVHTYYRCRNQGACMARAGVGGKMAEKFVVGEALRRAGTVWGTRRLGGDEAAAQAEALKEEATRLRDQLGEIAADLSLDLDLARGRTTAVKARLEEIEVELEGVEGAGEVVRWFVPALGMDHLPGTTYEELGIETTRDRFYGLPIERRRELLRALGTVGVVAPGKGAAEERIALTFTS